MAAMLSIVPCSGVSRRPGTPATVVIFSAVGGPLARLREGTTMGAAAASTVLIGDTVRGSLTMLARSQTAPHRLVVRARIVLAAAAGGSNTGIAERLQVSTDTVRTWRGRFITDGIAGLADRNRSGRPPRYGPDVRLRIIATVTEQTPEADSVWTHRLIAEHLHDDVGISASQIGRILADLDLKPHRVRGWLTRPADPDFYRKAAEVCDLYLHQPDHSIVVCIDEKTAISARSRKHPEQPATPGRPTRREFEYIRHGTVSIIAALHVHSGQVITQPIDRNNSATFIDFLTTLDQHTDPALTIDLVLDNGASHTSKATRTWLTTTPASSLTTPRNTPPGSTRPNCSSRS
jgi:transposase